MTASTDFSAISIIRELSALQAWVDQMTLRGFSMSHPMQLGDAFMLGLCLGTELSGGTCVHMPIDLLQEAAAILLADRESAIRPCSQRDDGRRFHSL